MTYFKVTDPKKKEYYLQHESGIYFDNDNKYIIVNNKLVNVEAYLNAIDISSMESISPSVYAENVLDELKRNTVILLVKPIAEGDSYTFSAIVSKIYSLNLKIDDYVEHIFNSNEVDTLYSDIKPRLEESGEYSGVKAYLTCGVSRILTVKGDNARSILKSNMGDKDSKKAAKGTMRAIAGDSITCNGVEIVDDNDNKLSVVLPIINGLNNSLGKQKTLKR